MVAGSNANFWDMSKGKSPVFIVNDNFGFSSITGKIDYAIAKSVFTHLTLNRIRQCLENLRPVLADDGIFYASIFLGDSSNNLEKDDDTRKFQYSLEEIKSVSDGWNVESLGIKGTFYQTMLKFKKVSN
jgi:hypothetical protein